MLAQDQISEAFCLLADLAIKDGAGKRSALKRARRGVFKNR